MSTSGKIYWYVRKKGKNWYLGIVSDTGVALSTANLDIDIYYDELANEVTNDQDTLPIPVQFEHGFVKGCVYDLLQMYGIDKVNMLREYENTIREAIRYQNEEANSPLIIKPLNFREDES